MMPMQQPFPVNNAGNNNMNNGANNNGNADSNNPEMQRQLYGEQLYMLVQPLSPSPYLAQKITGMLLELPQNELLLNLTNQEELGRRVQEALDVLREDGVA